METRSNHILVGGVTLILLASLIGFLVWIARIGDGAHKEYDIFFQQSVEGLSKGGVVTYAGVPSGEVSDIELWRDPGFVRVRVRVKDGTPIVQGTTASLQGSFTGPSSVLLDGGVKNAPLIVDKGPAGVPVIPTKRGGLGALLSNAPQLLERLTTLTERLTELLNDKNQKAFGSILANVDTVTGELARGGPDIRATISEARIAVKQAGDAAQQFSKLAGSADVLINEEGKPMIGELRKTAMQAQKSLANLDAAIGDVRPGLQTLTSQTIPEVGQLVRDLRAMSEALTSVATKLDQGGAGAILGPPALPDYKPGRSDK